MPFNYPRIGARESIATPKNAIPAQAETKTDDVEYPRMAFLLLLLSYSLESQIGRTIKSSFSLNL